MKTHSLVVTALAALVSFGCQSSGRDRDHELLERELRWQEDQIYELEAELDECAAQLQSAQRENMSLKKGSSADDTSGRRPLEALPNPLLLEAPTSPPTRQPPTRAGRKENTEPAEAPLVEPGVQIDPGEEFSPALPVEGAAAPNRIIDQRVYRIVLNKQLTGGSNRNGRAGDEGILVVFEPRNKAGQLLNVAGDVSIAVLDPSKPGPAGKIARWDFKAAEAAKQFRKSGMGRGYSFEIPWPGDPPTSQKLQLFVRFTAPDGRLIQADMPVTIAPSAPREARQWRSVPQNTRTAGRRDFPRADFSRDTADPQRWAGTNRAGQRMPPTGESAAPFTAPPQIAPPDEEELVVDESSVDGPQLPADRQSERNSDPIKTARPSWSPYR